jgi:4a-hydroxytetrahydrobiopterin dehydratase
MRAWVEIENQLYKKFDFDNYTLTMAFANTVAQIAESENHHPCMIINYGSVALWLSTHDAGDMVTQKDWQLSKLIDNI